MDFPLVKRTPTEVFFDGMTFRKLDDGRLQIFLVIRDGETNEAKEHELLYEPRSPLSTE